MNRTEGEGPAGAAGLDTIDQGVVWKEMAEFRCPPCRVDDHWNHQKAGQKQPIRGPAVEVGECRTMDGISERRCECSWREP